MIFCYFILLLPLRQLLTNVTCAQKPLPRKIKPHLYFILDIAGRFRISCNLLIDYISTIFVTLQTDIYSSVFRTSSVYTLQYCACPIIIHHCALLHCITLRYFSFCQISNFRIVKELAKRTQRTEADMRRADCPDSSVLAYVIERHCKGTNTFLISKHFHKNFYIFLQINLFNKVDEVFKKFY